MQTRKELIKDLILKGYNNDYIKSTQGTTDKFVKEMRKEVYEKHPHLKDKYGY